MVLTTVLLAALSMLSSAQAATPKCTKNASGYLSTTEYVGVTPHVTRSVYSFNSRNEVAYFETGKHPRINAEFQACTPNYANEKQNKDEVFFGRLYIPTSGHCLAVTNPSGAPPYYVASKPCPSLKDLATNASIPFNFSGFKDDDGFFRAAWVGGSIPSKAIFQGPNPGATNCYGTYRVNATSPLYGHEYGAPGEPSVSNSSKELNRVHLYCGINNTNHVFDTSFNTFVLIPPSA